MARIAELLRWKDWVMLRDAQGKDLKKIWLRVIGDDDLDQSFKFARLSSAQTRKALRDTNSDEYKEKVEYLKEATFEDCFEVIATSRAQNIPSEAISNIVRPDLVKIEEIAIDPDAPTLEEQEKLDAENAAIDNEYQTAIAAYIDQRKSEIEMEWRAKSLDEIREQAEIEISTLLALSAFFTRLDEEKCWRSVYEDEACKIRGFTDINEFRDQSSFIKQQVLDAYHKLELGSDEIKNSRKADLGE